MGETEKLVWATAFVQFATSVTYPMELSLPGREKEFAEWERQRTRNGIEYATSIVQSLRRTDTSKLSPAALAMFREVVP